jgi:enamine deaminase RidA (YjgF/YER057c/UK114 family)
MDPNYVLEQIAQSLQKMDNSLKEIKALLAEAKKAQSFPPELKAFQETKEKLAAVSKDNGSGKV